MRENAIAFISRFTFALRARCSALPAAAASVPPPLTPPNRSSPLTDEPVNLPSEPTPLLKSKIGNDDFREFQGYGVWLATQAQAPKLLHPIVYDFEPAVSDRGRRLMWPASRGMLRQHFVTGRRVSAPNRGSASNRKPAKIIQSWVPTH
ncbi:hypothetical protein M407DRAFT_4153 [Tulasnella calospora MUT 4182]|uniref:Uncharacterized protein n=1 Tax=Tulasnella calospora MUT 4182 TaxID=1051891 RepID=A0A0C3QUQ7_9AGAM|nr:hypothetical protein M407DRAFT_4153 [Tulasnella calospora MUT 4182]